MFEKILNTHFERYPAMEIQDVYKLIHQSVMGNTHFYLDPQKTMQALENEISIMGAGPQEPLPDPISLDGEIVRVHLRPYMAKGNDIQPLLEAFIRSAEERHRNTDLLESVWLDANQTRLWDRSEMDTFFNAMRDLDYPSVHHSEEFKTKYKPAYRVVKRKYIDHLL